MARCNNCGSHVTREYVRHWQREPGAGVEVCPWCPDRRRDGAGWKPARSVRRGSESHDRTVARESGQKANEATKWRAK